MYLALPDRKDERWIEHSAEQCLYSPMILTRFIVTRIDCHHVSKQLVPVRLRSLRESRQFAVIWWQSWSIFDSPILMQDIGFTDCDIEAHTL